MDINTTSLKLETPTRLTAAQVQRLDAEGHGEGDTLEAHFPVHPVIFGVVQAYGRVGFSLTCGHVRTGRGSEEAMRHWLGVPLPCRACAA